MKWFYYIDDSGQRKGPYTLEQMKEHYLFDHTLVWTEGLENWIVASKVRLLQAIIHKAPPPMDLIDTGEIESVTIGTQVWMKRNLDVSHFRNGDPIPEAKTNEEWEKAGEEGKPAWCFYKNDPEMGQHYGKLYNWYAVNDPRGLAPEGWHVPDDDEWTQLVAYIESQGYTDEDSQNGVGNALKSCRQVNSPLGCGYNTSMHPRWIRYGKHYGFDEFGFSALPGGYRYADGIFLSIGKCGTWWSSNECSSAGAWYLALDCNYGNVNQYNGSKAFGFSARCLRESDTAKESVDISFLEIKHEFESVKIGTQVWIKRNLDVSHFRNGNPITEAKTKEEWKKASKEGKAAWCFYINDPEIGKHYGKLYNWFAVNDPRGLAPEGWHVPSDDEWTQLNDYVESMGHSNKHTDPNGAGNALKSCQQVNSPLGDAHNTAAHPRWAEDDTHHGLDKFGFSGLPGGYRSPDGWFGYLKNFGCWWSSTEYSAASAWSRGMYYNDSLVGKSNGAKGCGFSVRCLRDV